MLFVTQSRKVKKALVLGVSTALMSFGAPAVSQAKVTHHHVKPAAGHSAPYTRSVVITTEWR